MSRFQDVAAAQAPLLLGAISQELNKQMEECHLKDIKLKKANYPMALENLQELIFFVQATAASKGLNGHYYVHIVLLLELSHQLNRFYVRFHQLFPDTGGALGEDARRSDIEALLTRHYATFLELVSGVLNNDFDVEYVVALNSPLLQDKLVGFLLSTLETLLHSSPYQDSEILDNVFRNITNITVNIYDEWIDNAPVCGSLFVLVTMLLKTLYTNGIAQYLVQVFGNGKHPSITPKTPLLIQARTLVLFPVIVDFYRYAGFCLVELSNSNDQYVIDSYNKQAQEYLDILLQIPSLNLSLFQIVHTDAELQKLGSSVKSLTQDHHNTLSLIEREEILLVYVFNYVLGLNRLEYLTNPKKNYKEEVAFLSKSLQYSLTSDIRQQSLPNSRSSSVSSLFQMQAQETPARIAVENTTNTNTNPAIITNNPVTSSKRCLTSIITNGSYLEKVNLVWHLLRELRSPKLNVSSVISNYNSESRHSSNFKHSYMMLEETDVGKLRYIKLVNKVSRLLALLSLKFMVDGAGMNRIPKTQLEDKFTIPLETIFSVKPLLNYNITENNVVELSTIKIPPTSVAQQLATNEEVLATTKLVNATARVLKS